ncbi:LuxR family transcriptional regulator [Amycolatopsis sp.]|uniref:helix-turn-helix transcriptional regulator n=1 Tax=Amycolatopsis sp. TaxID=37632 RepID=UPI002DFB3C31|nr:LuxR family transcriptional regulator [Amycolatopsis sp.]
MPDQGGTLPERLQKALHGSAQAVLLREPVGCGRAVLQDALAASGIEMDIEVRYVRCEESAADQGYEVVRRLLAPAGEAPAAGQPALPFLHGLSRIMVDLMSDGPQAIVVDDVQWCDEQSLRWMDFLLRRTQSLPLFILLSERTETGRRRFPLSDIFSHDRCVLVEMAAPPESCARPHPGSTADSTAARLDGQPWHVREVAVAVAVLGDAGGEAVGMLAGVPERSVATALGVLQELGVLSPAGATAILRDLPEDLLLNWRDRAARILNDTGRRAEDVASQLLHLPELKEPWMGTVLREAAAAARWDARPQAAARYLRRVVTDEPDDFGARMELANALAQIDPPAAAVVLEDMLERTTDAGHRAQLVDRLADAESAMQLVGWGRGPNRDGLRPTTEDWAEWQGYAGYAISRAAAGGPADLAVDYARRAVNATDEEASSCTTRTTVAYVLSLADLPDEALGELDKMLEADTADSPPWAAATVLTARAWTWNRIGEIAKCAADAGEAIRLTSEEDMALPKVALANALVAQGQADTAERLLGEISSRWLEEFGFWAPLFLLARSALHTYREDHENALDDALACGRSLAEAQIENAVFAPWWIPASFLLARLGRGAEAEDVVAHGEELAARWGTARGTGYAQLARGAITPGKPGLDLLFAATETLAGTPAKYQHAIAKSMLAQGLFQAGDVKGARKNFRQVVDLAVRCGAWALARKARTLLVAAGGRMQAVQSSPIDALSCQERRISELAAAGATNREIADTLSLALRTVEVHLTSVYRKLAISGRVELAPAFGSDRPEPDDQEGAPTSRALG